jgi:hypothetical protein
MTMYAIRVDDQRKLLHIELSGRITTAEALRAISQASVLAEASDILAVLCDVTRVEHGPGALLLVATSLNAAHRPGLRIALVANDDQLRVATRIVRFSGLRDSLVAFTSVEEAEAWLEPLPAAAPLRARSETEALLGRPVVVERTSRRGSRRVPPAA